MPGVEILYVEEITRYVWNGFVWGWGPAIAVFVGLVLIGLAIWISWMGAGGEDSVIAPIILGALILIGGCLAFYFDGTVPVYDHTEYKVIVDENVDMNKFFEEYELINVEGKIYNVKKIERE